LRKLKTDVPKVLLGIGIDAINRIGEKFKLWLMIWGDKESQDMFNTLWTPSDRQRIAEYETMRCDWTGEDDTKILEFRLRAWE
jgi:hypothetical protein